MLRTMTSALFVRSSYAALSLDKNKQRQKMTGPGNNLLRTLFYEILLLQIPENNNCIYERYPEKNK